MPPKAAAKTHAGVEPPACSHKSGAAAEAGIADLSCRECTRALSSPQTTVSQIFAVLRQWDSTTQGKLEFLVGELSKHGANIDDMDSISGQTALHFACKAGAKGVGNQTVASKVAADLINRGADVNVASLWTNMTAAHLAAFFGCDAVLQHLCRAKAAISTPCADFDGATPLHLAAMTGSIGAVSVLLDNGADATARDNFRRTPLQSAKLVMSAGNSDIPAEDWAMVVSLLGEAERRGADGGAAGGLGLGGGGGGGASGSSSGGLGVSPRPASSGLPVARGSPGGAVSPATPSSRMTQPRSTAAAAATGSTGAGAPASSPSTPRSGPTYSLGSGVPRPVSARTSGATPSTPAARVASAGAGANGLRAGTSVASSASTPRPASGIARATGSTAAAPRTPAARTGSGAMASPRGAPLPGGLPLGSRVMVGENHGVVRFVGATSFDTGTFIGVELDDACGRNDGSVEGVAYFKCEQSHGVFVRPARCTFRGLSCATLVS